ncbi:unnamed protein product, partial [Rotaria sp. Silwood1]
MGQKYTHPIPCYHGYASLPPSQRQCCRSQPLILTHTRAIPLKFELRHFIRRDR